MSKLFFVRDFFMLLGTLGAFCFAFSGLPQAWKSYKDGHSDGVAHGTILLWLLGEGMMLAYALYFYTHDYILTANYTFNFLLVSVIFKYKYWRRPVEITSRITKKVQETVIEKIICNKCGAVCEHPKCGYEGLRINHMGGYGSRQIGDGTIVKFDLCEDCMVEMFKSFKHAPEYNEAGWLGGGVVDEDGNPLDQSDDGYDFPDNNGDNPA